MVLATRRWCHTGELRESAHHCHDTEPGKDVAVNATGRATVGQWAGKVREKASPSGHEGAGEANHGHEAKSPFENLPLSNCRQFISIKVAREISPCVSVPNGSVVMMDVEIVHVILVFAVYLNLFQAVMVRHG